MMTWRELLAWFGGLLTLPLVFAMVEEWVYKYIICWWYSPTSMKRISYEAARNGDKPIRPVVFFAAMFGTALFLVMLLIEAVFYG
jgi:hypothetical protein